MKRLFVIVSLLCAAIALTSAVDKNNFPDDPNSSCSQSECLRCDLGSSVCAKCLHVMMVNTRACQMKCPLGYDPIWAEEPDVFGRICQERSVLAMVSHREVGIIAGASVLGAICVGIFLGVLLLLHKKGIKSPPDSPPRGLPRLLQDKRPKTAEVTIKGKERAEFLARLQQLRSDAPYILRMMAATRNRFRSGTGPTGNETLSDAKTKACKAVVRDLSRVLCLLSLKEEYLQTAPKDWRSLLSWTERLLARYKRQEENQVQDKIGGQAPLTTHSREEPSKDTRTHFVTRQQQLKAEKDRRRLGGIEFQASEEKPEEGLRPYSIVAEEDYSEKPFYPLYIEDATETPTRTSTEHSPVPLTKKSFPTQRDTERMKIHLGKVRKIKIRDFLNMKKHLWFRLPSAKPTPKLAAEDDPEKGTVADIMRSSTMIEDLEEFAIDEDDIPSQTFFDHIEAFAFEIQSDLIPSEEKSKPDIILTTKPGSDSFMNNNSQTTNNNIKNTLNLYRNYKNSQLFAGIRPHPPFCQDGGKCVNCCRRPMCPSSSSSSCSSSSKGKPKRPGRLRRLSSSILMKDKKHLSLKGENPKQRRPLKRQKRVEKQIHSQILQKYKKGTKSETPQEQILPSEPLETSSAGPSSSSGEETVVDESRLKTGNGAGHYSDDVSSSCSFSASSLSGEATIIPIDGNCYVNQSEDPYIKIIHASEAAPRSRFSNARESRNRRPECYTRCEILTNV